MKKTLTLLLLITGIGISSAQTDSTGLVLKIFLQGAASGSSMQTLLNQNTLLPFQHPYDTAPWNYTGTESLNTIPANMVDWVLVEVRSRIDTIVSRRAAVLLSNGSIVDTNGSPGLKIPEMTNNFYFVVYHRNHLPMMTANTVAYANTVFYDFTDTLNFPVLGNDVINVGGKAAMIAGDVNANKQLKYSGPGNDRAPILQRILGNTGGTSITGTTQGYYGEDLTMEGTVKYSGPGNDPAKIIQNLVSKTGSSAITSVYNSHIPDGYIKKSCGDTLVDSRDGQKYPTVQIGNQCWMGKNLNIGTSVTSVYTGSVHSDVSNNGVIEKYCYNNDTSMCRIYGGLYDWDEMMDYDTVPGSQGICPHSEVWQIPSDWDWTILASTLGGSLVAGGELKEAGTAHWNSPNTGSTNASGFTALPGGYRHQTGYYAGINIFCGFWTSSASSSTFAISRYLYYNYTEMSPSGGPMKVGHSVRCVLDSNACTLQPSQSNAGPDQLNVEADSVILQANAPVYGLGVWSIASGNGGTVNDSLNPNSVFYGIPDSSYSLVWNISTQCGVSRDTVIISFAPPPFNCGSTLIDSRDGKQYPTVQIGTQCWMAKNLNIGVYKASVNTGTSHSDVSNNGIIEKYCYNNDANKCDVYGGLYEWDEMMGYDTTPAIQGICPPNGGWHIPTDSDWMVLENYLGGSLLAGGKMKETGTMHWISPNSGATNISGFTGLPGGYRVNIGYFNNEGGYVSFWSSSICSSASLWNRSLGFSYQSVYTSCDDHLSGFSIRCLKNTP